MAESQPEIATNHETSSMMNGYTETSYLCSDNKLEKIRAEKRPAEKSPVEKHPAEKSPAEGNLDENNLNKPPGRRADIDVIMIFLTYGIYLFHLCHIYSSGNAYGVRYPNLTNTSVSEDPFTVISIGHIVHWFTGFMHAWNMPMFFYLSGQNAYSALFRRSETQFRDERVHRLLVPTLFVSLVTQFPLTLSYFAPRDTPLVEESYWEYAKGFYKFVGVNQAWFLLYLFIYAQMFTYWFRAFHPAHNTADTTTLSCCGSTACCCTVKPFNCLTKFFCCLNFLFRPAITPEEFVSAVKWFLGGSIRLALIPGVVIGVAETSHNLCGGILRSFPFFSYMVIFVLGYATAAADKQIRQDSKLWSWTCFIVGAVMCSVFGIFGLVISGWDVLHGTGVSVFTNVVGGFTRGIGQWLFLIGSIALAREKFTAPRDWHHKYRMMAMPFYLIHVQVLIPFAAGALWVPYLRTLPVMLVLTSYLIITLSYLITKSGSLRYFFGLPPPDGSCLPGKQLRGFVPVLVLSGLVVIHILLARVL